MPAPHVVRAAAIAVIFSALALACDDDPTSAFKGTGAIRTTVTTTGAELDPDGYSLGIDSGTSIAIGVNASRMLADLPIGEHLLWLDGLASNCQLAGPNPRRVVVS